MVIRALLLVVAAALAACIAPAAEVRGRCSSLAQADQDCPPPPRVTYGPNLRVEVVTAKRKLAFPAPQSGISDVGRIDAYCPGGKCVCDEDLQRLDFKGPVPGFAQANAAEWRAVQSMKCSAENSNVMRHVLRFAVTQAAVSTAAFELAYCHECNGSCHGHAVLAAYDARNGVPILLRDAIAPGQLKALKRRLAADFVAKNFDAADRAFGLTAVREDVEQITLESGLYIEPGRAFVNLDTFALSCADGPFHPVEIPAEFLSPAFRARISR